MQHTNALHVIPYFEFQAEQCAERTALLCDEKSFNYKELNEKANQLARFLRAQSIGAGNIVAISLEHSHQKIIGILGILKAGAAYLPIDAEYPEERIRYTLADSGVSALMTSGSLADKLSALFTGEIINLDSAEAKISGFLRDNLDDVSYQPTDLAYVLYTSGTTGQPKGVMIPHSNLMNAYLDWNEVYQLEAFKDTHLQMANFAFDVFTGDWVRALCSGSTLVLCPKCVLVDPQKLYALMEKAHVKCAEFVPTVLRRLLDYLENTGKTLDFMRLLICGSDNWSFAEYDQVKALCSPQTRVINSYGLTEATIDSTYFEESPDDMTSRDLPHPLPIGKPFPHTHLYVIDEDGKLMRRLEFGEIYIGGTGVALGYLNKPELTQGKFVTHCFEDGRVERLYRTGDIGRKLKNGNYEFLGRMDNQLKLNGIRVELNEIETALNRHPVIKESIVSARENETGKHLLIAHVVTRKNVLPNHAELHQFLSDLLPSHMIPSYFFQLPNLPTTPNGKINRQVINEMPVVLIDVKKDGPRNKIEFKLVEICQEILHRNNIGIFDPFSHLGGDSLSLVTFTCEVEKVFEIEVFPCHLTTDFTIAEVAETLKKKSYVMRKSRVKEGVTINS